MKDRKDFSPENFDFKGGVDGLSEQMLSQHVKLYEGYVKKTNEIQAGLEEADKSLANGVYSQIGELKRQETFAVNGMKLHEVYFGHLKGDGQPKGPLKKMIEKDWGGVKEWKQEMVATGLSARGWAILAFDFKDRRLHIYGSDAHNVGAVWNAIAIFALDVYEHAYFMDYGIGRKEYIEKFFKNLDWDFANKIVANFNLEKLHGSQEAA